MTINLSSLFKTFSFMCFVSCVSITLYGQERSKRNMIHLELGGHGYAYSINFERTIVDRSDFKTTLMAGLAYYPKNIGLRDLWLPFSVNEILALNDRHGIELGLGYTFIYSPIDETSFSSFLYRPWGGAVIGRIGYRYTSSNQRMILKAGFTPFLEPNNGYPDFHPHLGGSIGFAF